MNSYLKRNCLEVPGFANVKRQVFLTCPWPSDLPPPHPPNTLKPSTLKTCCSRLLSSAQSSTSRRRLSRHEKKNGFISVQTLPEAKRSNHIRFISWITLKIRFCYAKCINSSGMEESCYQVAVFHPQNCKNTAYKLKWSARWKWGPTDLHTHVLTHFQDTIFQQSYSNSFKKYFWKFKILCSVKLAFMWFVSKSCLWVKLVASIEKLFFGPFCVSH